MVNLWPGNQDWSWSDRPSIVRGRLSRTTLHRQTENTHETVHNVAMKGEGGREGGREKRERGRERRNIMMLQAR